jgi:site-specific DNA-methyltransferase (adenine-specific)
MYKLLNGDCLDEMKKIEDESVDMVLTDPPYQLNNWTNPMKWDKIIDLDIVWVELNRICKYGIAICLFGNEPYSTIQRNSNPKMFKYDMIWIKNKITSPMLAKVRPLKKYEIISVFSTGKTSPGRDGNMKYYPQGLISIDKTVKNNKKDRSIIQNRPSIKDTYKQKFTNYPSDILDFKCESGLHPTQKPVALMEYLIKTYTNENETVLDFTMGSGTTGVACVNTNRNFIGIELDEDYFKIAQERIQNAQKEKNSENFFNQIFEEK